MVATGFRLLAMYFICIDPRTSQALSYKSITVLLNIAPEKCIDGHSLSVHLFIQLSISSVTYLTLSREWNGIGS